MNQMKIYFRAARPRFSNDPVSYWEEGQQYLVLFLVSQNTKSLFFSDKIYTRLLVAKDNSALAKRIKETIDKNDGQGDFFATPFTNLKFKPNFSEKVAKDYKGHALLIKDPSQVEKLVGTGTNPSPYQITFKVLREHKEGYGYGNGKKLSYQESFSQYGSYEHILEIEPLDLGIEGLPPITHLSFSFFNTTNPLVADNYELTKCELYKSPVLANAAGKNFTIKVKEFKVDSSKNTLGFSSNYEYVFGSLVDEKAQNSLSPPNTAFPKKNWWIVLIIGGIIIGFSLFYKKKKKKN